MDNGLGERQKRLTLWAAADSEGVRGARECVDLARLISI